MTRSTERAVLAGHSAQALQLVDETLRVIDEQGSAAVVTALAHRLRGYALMQSGTLEEAGVALEQSLQSASSEAGTDAEAESYELALTLEALTRLAELRGGEDPASRDKSEQIFGRLGVTYRPTVPLPARVPPVRLTALLPWAPLTSSVPAWTAVVPV